LTLPFFADIMAKDLKPGKNRQGPLKTLQNADYNIQIFFTYHEEML